MYWGKEGVRAKAEEELPREEGLVLRSLSSTPRWEGS